MICIYSVQQLEDWQTATRRYDSRAQDVNHWLGNMEGKLVKFDLEVQDINAVDLQIHHLKVSMDIFLQIFLSISAMLWL